MVHIFRLIVLFLVTDISLIQIKIIFVYSGREVCRKDFTQSKKEGTMGDCFSCGGSGNKNVDADRPCTKCNGSGKTYGHGETCMKCNGGGTQTYSSLETCSDCGGSGQSGDTGEAA